MTIVASGPISTRDIRTEFGGAGAISPSNYYRTAGLDAADRQPGQVPSTMTTGGTGGGDANYVFSVAVADTFVSSPDSSIGTPTTFTLELDQEGDVFQTSGTSIIAIGTFDPSINATTAMNAIRTEVITEYSGVVVSQVQDVTLGGFMDGVLSLPDFSITVSDRDVSGFSSRDSWDFRVTTDGALPGTSFNPISWESLQGKVLRVDPNQLR